MASVFQKQRSGSWQGFQPTFFPRPADNYCSVPTKLSHHVKRLDLKLSQIDQNVNCFVVNKVVLHRPEQTFRDICCKKVVSYQDVVSHAHSVTSHGQPQKKGSNPVLSLSKIKVVKGVSCVSPCLFAPSFLNAPHVITEISVGGRLQNFWQVWQKLGSNPRVVPKLRDGYTLPFRERPQLGHFPLIVSKYASPVKNKALLEALSSLVQKKAVKKVVVKLSLAFYNRLFLVLKPNSKWRLILDLSKLNLFLDTNTFKMETPETIRLSLQQGEWVTSLDFSDAYFHIPIVQRSRKYLKFHLNTVSYQFRALPFGLATAPLEFTKVVKEVKLMAQDLPVPRRLVVERSLPGNVSTTYLDPPGPLPRTGLGSKP